MTTEVLTACIAGAIAVAAALIKGFEKLMPARPSLPALDELLRLQQTTIAPTLAAIAKLQDDQIELQKEGLALQRQVFQMQILGEERHKAHAEQTVEIKRQLLAHIEDERASLRTILDAVKYRNGG